eukprot:scaffold5887_cov122-Cylindrotheca_fusiformis.AAC.17
MTFEVNQEALETYRQKRKSQIFEPVELEPQLEFLPSSGLESPISPSPRTTMKSKNRPTSDRSLRVDAWIGGHGPDGAKPRRSWIVKREITK